ncbi:flagellar protein FlaG [Paenibacillus sp. YN15]|uniref:flagellar protein FlaG n=1 Tax=Paenibacillus sp. YN15 TaxID=1742774 RepID=UPI00215D503D|nr:flagellar protein FlaG [Paenibacillus sp. YN15]
MGANDISFGQSGYPASVPELPVRVKEIARDMTKDVVTVQTSRDLKQAELQGEAVPISEEQLIRAIERSVKALQGTQTSLKFSVHEKTNQIMVKVVNSDSGEVIREIPPEKTMDFVARLWEMAGILVDERR